MISNETKELRNSIQEMRDSLQKMLKQKKEQTNNPTQQQQIGDRSLILELLKLKSMRKKHRSMQVGIEEERAKIRLEKEKIEKTSVYLSGLEYLQTTLQNEITHSQALQLKDLPDIGVKGPVVDCSELNQLKSSLGEELQKRVKKNEEAISVTQKLKDVREKHESIISQFSSGLQPVLLGLSENLKSISSIFPQSTQFHVNPQQHMLAAQLPSPLYSVYSKFSVLYLESSQSSKESEQGFLPSTVEIQQSTVSSVAQKTQHHSQFAQLEVVLNVNSFNPILLQHIDQFLAAAKITSNNAKSMQQIYPFKLYIRYIPNIHALVIQLDSKVLKGKEIFSGLVENDFGSVLFPLTTSEYEKNLNQQYELYNWLQILGGTINSGDTTHKLETSDLMRKINERVVSKRVIKSIFDALAAGVFQYTQLVRSSKENVMQTELNKYKFECKQRLLSHSDLASSQHFKKLTPQFLRKTGNNDSTGQQLLDLLEIENSNQPLGQQLQEQLACQNAARLAGGTSGIDIQRLLLEKKDILKLLNMNCQSNETDAYLFSVSKGDQFAALFFIIMPLTTLTQIPSVKFVSACARMNTTSSTKTPLNTLFAKDLITPVIESSLGSSNPSTTDSNVVYVSSGVLAQIESDLMDIQSLMPEGNNDNNNNTQFGLIYQINRMLTLFELTIAHYQRYQSLPSKAFASTQFDLLDL